MYEANNTLALPVSDLFNYFKFLRNH